MGERYAPVPDIAADVCGGRPLEEATVYRLYRMAHDQRWRPMMISVRDVADLRGVTRHAAQRLLSALEASGLLQWDRAGRGVGSITVYDPTTVSHRYGQRDGQRDGQTDPEQTPEVYEPPDSVPDSVPDKAPPKPVEETALSRPLDYDHDQDLHSDKASTPRPLADGDALAHAAHYSAELGLLRPMESLPPRECGAIGAALRRGDTAEQIGSLVAWILESNEEPAHWLRGKALSWTSLTRSDRWRLWLRDACAWEDRGRCDYQKPTIKEEKAAAFTVGIGEFMERETRKATAFDAVFEEVKRGK